MTTYGNSFWNKATDNSTISVIPMREKVFLKLQPMLEDAGLNYYAFAQNGALKMAVNDKDIDWMKRIIGSPAADELIIQKSNKPYSPPNMNIIGNTEYKYMPQKSYFKTDRDVALKMAELLEREGIRFSGRIYANSDTATLTVSEPDAERLKAINQQVIKMRSSMAETEPPKDKEIVGNTEYKNISKRNYIFSKATPEQYKELQPYLDEQGVQYSGLIRNGKVMFTVSENDAVNFDRAFNTAINMVMVHEDLKEENFSEAQIESLSDIIKEAAQKDLTYTITHYFNPEYSEKQFTELIPLVSAYVHAPENDRILDKNGVLSNILALRSRFDSEIAIGEIISQHDYSDEQKAALLDAFQKGVSLSTLDELDETYSPDEISQFAAIMSSGDIRSITEFVEKHQEKQIEAETKQPIVEETVQEESQPVIENESQAAFNIPSITDSLKADFESGGLTFKEVAAELKHANLIPHERDYKRTAELIGIDEADQRIAEIFTEKPPVSAEQKSSERTEMRSEKTESLETGENKNVKSENDTPHKTYRIYQIKGGEEYHGIRFSDYSTLEKDGFKPNHEDYDMVYQGKKLKADIPDSELLESIYTIFNLEHPEDFKGHSLSVSDVVVIGESDKSTAYFVDSVGYKELPEFFMEKERTQEKEEQVEDILTPEEIAEVRRNLEANGIVNGMVVDPEKLENSPFIQQVKRDVEAIESKQLSFEDMTAESEAETSAPVEKKSDNRVTITCNWSESPVFEEGKTYTVAEFDGIMADADKERHDGWKAGLEEYGNAEAWEMQDAESYYRYLGYDKTSFTVNLPNGDSITERQDIGDGYGGVIDFFRSFESLKQYVPLLEAQRDMDIAINQRDELKAVHDEMEKERIEKTEKTPISSQQEFSEPTEIRSEKTESLETDEKRLNFTITDNSLGEGGAKSKFKDNIAAIETLKIIEAENRPATPEEQEILSRYVGWGGLQAAFDSENKAWSSEYALLKETLTDKEYSAARASTLDSFYTSPAIIDGIYEALDSFGFTGGNVLEPSMGIGNFFGRMPEDMQKNSQLYGVEIDSISGRIAQKLYPDADIAIKGFEKNTYQKGSFDIAVGNVPFGDLGFKDEKHGTTKLHDYFFAETLDKVKNGGIVAFVTSAGTLDKRDESTRQMLADKADLIGAVRLPGGKNGAFKDYAGTEATTDIIFLQKHDNKSVSEMSDIPDWVHIGQTEDSLPINKYFENHPDMVLGTVIEGNKLYGTGTMVVAEDGADLKAQLHEAVSKLSAQISDERPRDVYPKEKETEIRPPEELRNYSLFEHENKIYFKLADRAYEFRSDNKNSVHQRAKAFIALRDCTRELLTAQEQNKPDNEIKGLQEQLNTLYDDFYKKYGLLHSKTNKRYFSEDVSYNLVSTLEKAFDKDKLLEKSDIFTKRTIRPAKAATHVDSAMEALALSAAEKACVDFAYMQSLTGMTKEELLNDLHGEIFLVPFSVDMYQTASEYLSGDIRQKLKTAQEAAETDSRFAINVAALEKVMPEPLKAADIEVRLGAAAWIHPKIYQQFMYETFGTPNDKRDRGTSSLWRWSKPIKIEYSEVTGTYRIQNKRADMSVTATKTFGTSRMNAYEITEHLLNLKDPKIYKTVLDEEGKEKRVIDPDATRIVQSKADKIKAEFKDWIFKDPERREQLVQQYNEKFNCIRPREFDGSHLSFPNMNAEIKLHDHQKNAIAHALFGGNTLFAHSVGAGKTFEMIATAMESKRLGLCTKSLFAVPNHLTEQIGDDFLKLYPSANVLVATKNDFKKENRQQLFAKIATGNFDAVIIGHSQLGMIPISKERQVALLQEQIDDVLRGIQELKQNEGSKFQVKAMERTRKSLQKQLDKLDKSHDDTISFEQMGIDKLFVDEAHEFKNLFTPTKLQNISGISNSASQKALDLFLKCRYLDEKTDGKGVVFATGTPLSNSVTELHTMMRYLEYDFLKEKNLQHFDNWVTVFGEQKTDWELAPAGNKFKERTRIANYTGLPELMSMFKQIADIKTADSLNLDVPECEMHIVNVEATEFQKTLVDELAARADEVQAGNIDPSIDNMLRITSDGRKLGLDPRLIDPSFEDNPDTKLNQCVENVFRIYEDTSEEKLTQIVFCDLGVPHKTASAAKDGADAEEVSAAEANSLEEECDFCVYDDIKQKLMDKGIPENEIAYIHNAKTEKQKSELFDKVRSGEVRVLLGSTSKMGTGTNVQKRLIAVHDLDIPWRPADLEQRAGRIIRQGNENKNVHIFRYVTKGTFDAYSYQTLENKQKFISQIMTSKTPVRKCEDVDQQALTYSEIKALCTGDERIKEKMQLDNEVKELRLMKAEHTNTVYEMQDKVRAFPANEERLTSLIEGLEADRKHIDKLPVDPETMQPKFRLTIGDTVYTDRKEAAQAFENATYDAIKVVDTPVKIGEFQGFPLSVQMDSFSKRVTASLSGSVTHRAELIGSFPHNLKRLESALNSVYDRIRSTHNNLSALRIDYAEAEKLAVQPFPREAELAQKEERLATLTTELNEAAAEAKKNKPQQRTCYFDRAKLKKEAAKSRAAEKKQPEKKKKQTLE